MLSDANPMVVANALAAMQEIQEVSGKEVLQITPHTLFKLLAALNECTEWGQVGVVARFLGVQSAHSVLWQLLCEVWAIRCTVASMQNRHIVNQFTHIVQHPHAPQGPHNRASPACHDCLSAACRPGWYPW
jgi:hypothetical protein